MPVLALLSLAAGDAGSQGQPPAPSPPPCSAPEHRQFDFWIGEWDVSTPDGKLAGVNLITREHGGCLLREQWRGEGGMTGTSLNGYSGSRRQWHQTWMDNAGTVLLIDGAYADGRMVMTGTMTDRQGKPVRNRISWEPRADGTVRQVWEIAREGEDWKVVFDGRYVRRPPAGS
jgi:hypothetical protein